MKQYEPHLYMICYPNAALVLSQLQPKDFVYRYSYGSTSYHSGKLVFAEIDINYRHPYFRIDEALENLHPHEDGGPKASKYISSYRVLEHVDVDAVRMIYLVNSDGTFFPLEPGEYHPEVDDSELHVYAEITPLTMMTLSRYNMREFGRWFTGENQYLSVPRLLYLEMNLDVDAFLEDFKRNPFAPPPLAGVHPAKLRNAIQELKSRPDKPLKGLTLDTVLSQQSYRSVKTGIMLMDAEKEKFFPMPALAKIERNDLKFYKSM